jgi:hypothetical protein
MRVTEEDWLASCNPKAMLGHLRPKFSDRKLRLFACACCRRVLRLASDARIVGILNTLERYANGEGRERDRIDARKAAEAIHDNVNKPQDCISSELRNAAQKTLNWGSWHPGSLAAAAVGWSDHAHFAERKSEERAEQAPILREMVGNPFRPVALDPAWLTSDVLALARGIYDDRAFDRMPILADALQDAGCTNDDILNHCRGDGPHVRGCWVIDLLLGKA